MPIPGFLSITGQTQGPIEGSCDIDGLEGTIEIYSFDHQVHVPRSGHALPLGHRVHDDITISKLIDKSTPKLYQAMCSGEMLTEVLFSWYNLSEKAGNEKLYSVRVTNGIITKVRPWKPNRLDESKQSYQFMEDVSIAYEKIAWVWEPDGIEYEDTWTVQTTGA